MKTKDSHPKVKTKSSLKAIDKAIKKATDNTSMLQKVMSIVLKAYDCDRAFIIYPCDPKAREWSPIECTKEEYPGLSSLGQKLLIDESARSFCELLLQQNGVVTMGPDCEFQIPEFLEETFDLKSQLSILVNPSNDSPYNFGLQQCSYPRVWNEKEKALIREIALRLTKALEI